MFHITSIISVSLSSWVLCFPTNSVFALLVAKIGTSVLMHMLVANWFIRDGSFTFSPSRRSSKSFQHISSLLHLNSFKTITSAWSAPTQAYLSFLVLVNARKIISSGSNKNVFPQFAGATINTQRNLLLPCSSKSLLASASVKGFMLLNQRMCLAHSYQSMSQQSTQPSDWHFLSTSILVIFSRSMEACELFIPQVFSMRLMRDLLDLDNTKSVKSICPSSFHLFTSLKSVLLYIVFNKNSLTSN